MTSMIEEQKRRLTQMQIDNEISIYHLNQQIAVCELELLNMQKEQKHIIKKIKVMEEQLKDMKWYQIIKQVEVKQDCQTMIELHKQLEREVQSIHSKKNNFQKEIMKVIDEKQRIRQMIQESQ